MSPAAGPRHFDRTNSIRDLGSFACIAVALAPFIALKTVNVRRVLLALLLLDLPLQFDMNIGNREDVAVLGSLAGYNLSITTAALAGLYALWLTDFLTRSGNTRPLRLRLS